MKFDSGTRTRLLVDMALDFNPSGTTLEVLVDGTSYAAGWLGSATTTTDPQTGRTTWLQTGQTTGYFAGPGVAVPAGAVVLAAGPHSFETRITSGQDIIETPLRPAAIRVED